MPAGSSTASQATRHSAVVVTDGETRAALACVRALGRRGLEVHVLAGRRRSLAGASRHAAAEHEVPDPARAPRAWAQQVERVCAGLPGALLLPVTEVALGSLFLAGTHTRCEVAAPPEQAYAVATDKQALLERARAAGLGVPPTTPLPDPASLSSLPSAHAYPVVLKARRSRWLDHGTWHAGGVWVARDEPELRSAARDPGLAAGALLQDFVPGHGEGLFFLVEHGRVRVRFAHRRLREKPPQGGVSVLAESIAPDPALLAGCERLLRDLAWHGVAMAEFRRTPRGEALLMEVNPRLWGSLQLAVDAGVDFPWLLVALLRGEPLPAVEPRLGVRTRWLLGDLDHLLHLLRRPALRRELGRSATGALGAFLRSFADGSRAEELRRDDLRPLWRALRAWRT